MPDLNKQVNVTPLDTKSMRVSGDAIFVGGAKFKRTVLPSAAAPNQKPEQMEAERLIDEWEAEQTT